MVESARYGGARLKNGRQCPMTIFRPVVFAAVLTLAPIQADAACAWVLWVATFHPDMPPLIDPSGAFETKAECDAALSRREPREMPSDSRIKRHFACYPDTVDPRGPKGGAR